MGQQELADSIIGIIMDGKLFQGIERTIQNWPKVRDDATKVRDRRDGSGRSRLKFQVYQLVNPFLNDPY